MDQSFDSNVFHGHLGKGNVKDAMAYLTRGTLSRERPKSSCKNKKARGLPPGRAAARL